MGNRAGLLFVLALASGSVAAFLAFSFLRSPASPTVLAAAERETVSVVVAARDLDVGTTLVAEDVKLVEWPGAALPAGFATSVEEVAGLGILVPVYINEPLLPLKMASNEVGRGLAMLVPDGYRAVSVPVNSVTAVAGWVRPGTHVDVMVTLNSVRTEVEPVTQVVLQNVMVLGNNQSIGRNSGGQATDIGVVTLLVTPEEAEKLAMAESNGRLHLALRNYLDADTVDTPGIRTSGLLRRAALPPAPSGGARAPAPPPVRRIIEVIRGQQRSEVRPGGGG